MANRNLSFQGRLTDAQGTPIDSGTNLRMTIYDSETATGAALLWQEVVHATPDSDGIFNVLLGKNTPIPQSLFATNPALWLGVSVETTSELEPRQPIATVAYAVNAETLQGLPPITNTTRNSNVILALNSSGNLTIGGSAGHIFRVTGGNFTLTGQTLTLSTNTGSNGNVTINPDGSGVVDIQKIIKNTSGNNSSIPGAIQIDDTLVVNEGTEENAILNINQASTGDLIAASVSGETRFAVDNGGNVFANGSFNGMTVSSGTITSATWQAAVISSTYGGTGINSSSSTGVPFVSAGTWSIDANSLSVSHGGTGIESYNTGDIIYATSSGGLAKLGIGGNGNCLVSNGSAPTWSSCSTTSTYQAWSDNLGAVFPVNSTEDFLVGGQSTTSAKFAILNVSGAKGAQTASISGSITLDSSTASIQTANFQPLTIGGNSTGGLTLLSGNGSILLSNNATVSGTFTTNSTVTFSGLTTDGGLIYTNTSGEIAQTATGSLGECLISNGGGAPSWGSCSGSGTSNWNVISGTIYPKLSDSLDFFIGGSSTTSAKFALLNINGARGTQTASLSGTLVLDSGSASIESTNFQTLTLGGNNTGSVVIDSGSSLISILDNTSVTGTLGASALISANGGLSVASGQSTTLASFSTNGGLLYTDGSGILQQLGSTGTSSECLLGNASGAPSWGTCPSSGGNTGAFVINESTGTINQLNTTTDFLIGGTATNSAKFAILNANGTSPVIASVSGNLIVMPVDGAGGNVGIGIVNPSYKLDVAGNINSTATVSAQDVVTAYPYADVRAFGGVGDGSTDDTTAIQNAINSGGHAMLNPNKTYRITNTLVVGANEALFVPNNATLLFDSPTASIAAVEVQGTGKLYGTGTIESNRSSWDNQNPQFGVLLSGSQANVDIGYIDSFEWGVYLRGASQGSAYNDVKVGTIVNSIQAVKLDATGTGWVNQNYIHVSRLTIWSDRKSADPTNWNRSFGIYMDSHTVYAPNANRFSGSIEGVKTGMYLTGNYNRLDGLRFELTGGDPLVQIEDTTNGDGTSYNWWFGEYAYIDWNTDITGSAKTQRALIAYGVRNLPLYSEQGLVFGDYYRSPTLSYDTASDEIRLEKESIRVFTYNANGYFDLPNVNVGIGMSAAPKALLDIEGANAGQALVQLNELGDQDIFTASVGGTTVFRVANDGTVELNLATAGTTNDAICWDGSGSSLLYDCDSTPADYAESYPVERDVTYGDIVMATNVTIKTKIGTNVPRLVKATNSENAKILGVTSDNWHDFTSAGKEEINSDDNPLPVALNGRVLTKVTTQNGDIKIGDPITASSIPGVGMKSIKAETIVGTALENYSSSNPNEIGQILVFINPGQHSPAIMFASNLDGLELNEVNDNFQITKDGTLLDKAGAYSDLLVAKIKAGYLELGRLTVTSAQVTYASIGKLTTDALSITTENVTIAGVNLRDYIANIVDARIGEKQIAIASPILETDIIKPGSGNKVAVQLPTNDSQSSFEVNNASGSAVASINANGDVYAEGEISARSASISGSLTSNGIQNNRRQCFRNA